MKLVIFGLTITSSWGNGHATLWRGLCKSLARRGHKIVFFERDVPYYALNRDLMELPYGELCLYPGWQDALPLAHWHLSDADAAMVTSYCPDAVAASDLILEAAVPVRTFYDLDTPVTLARLEAGEAVDYIGPRALSDFDLVLSYTGGRALAELQKRLGPDGSCPCTAASIRTGIGRPTEPHNIAPTCPTWALTLPIGSPRWSSCSSSRRDGCPTGAS